MFEDDAGVVAGMMEYLQMVPRQAKYFNVELDAEGSSNPADGAAAAKGWVIIRCRLL